MAGKKRVRSAFRAAVFERDGYRCAVCGKPGRDRQGAGDPGTLVLLDAHHITDRHELPGGGYVAENGISLCDDGDGGGCHGLAEAFHRTGEAAPGYSPEELYVRISSSKESATEAAAKSAAEGTPARGPADGREAVILVGLQGSGKSTFCEGEFFRTHVRISLDMLKTRHRETRFLEVCVETGQSFVVDNTNPSTAERGVYIRAARRAGFRVVGYYFQSRVEDCIRRNDSRPDDQRVPRRGILGTAARMTLPNLAEGFDRLCYVRIEENDGFVVEEWADEVR